MGVHASTVGSRDLETEEIGELNCIRAKVDEACTQIRRWTIPPAPH